MRASRLMMSSCSASDVGSPVRSNTSMIRFPLSIAVFAASSEYIAYSPPHAYSSPAHAFTSTFMESPEVASSPVCVTPMILSIAEDQLFCVF